MANGKFVAYYRVSTKKQGDSGLGLEAQQADVNRHMSHCKGTLIAAHEDIESGTRKGTGKRPGLDKALADCKLHKATLVIAKFDRLHRNVAALTALLEAGVEMVACDNPNANRMFVQILAVIAEEEAEKISQRTRAALAVRKSKGLPMGAQCWESAKGVLSAGNQEKGRALSAQSNRTKADAAAKMITAKIEEIKQELGELSFHEIAQELNKREITTGNGKRWAYASVRNAIHRTLL